MSRTDKTRPGWVQESDPLNQRFRRISQYDDWFWKKVFPLRGCWCCSQKKAFYFDERKKRAKWRTERQELLSSWRYELWLWEDIDFYDHWSDNDEEQEGLRFVDFYGTYTVG